MIKNDLSISIYIYKPYLEVLKAGLDGALSNFVQWEVCLPTAQVWNEIMFKVLSSPVKSMIL